MTAATVPSSAVPTASATRPLTLGPPPTSFPGFAGTALVVAGRTVKKFLRTPQLVVVAAVQGAMFLLIFRYVFGGAIQTGDVSYVDYLVPGYIVTGVLFSGMGAAAGMAEDVASGFHDRLRSLPVSRVGVLSGRSLADTGLVVWGLVITVAVGFAVGFRIHNGVPEAVAGLGLCVVYGFAFTWLFIVLGLAAGSAQAAQGLSLLVFPFTFVSSAFVPVSTMPGWLQPIAEHQPLTPMTDAVRSLALGPTDSGAIVASLVWSVALVAAFVPIALVMYRKR